MTAPVRSLVPQRLPDPAFGGSTRKVATALLSCLLLDPSRIPSVLEILEAAGVGDSDHKAIFEAMLALHSSGQPLDLWLLAAHLEREGKLGAVGGVEALAEIVDFEPTAHYAEYYARTLRRHSLENRASLLHERLAGERNDADLAELAAVEAKLASIGSGLDLTTLGFTGPRLVEIRERAEPQSPIPSLLDPEPSLVVLNGRPKTAKTRLALWLAQAWASGSTPWPGAERLPGTRALVISAEQPAVRVERTLRQLDAMAAANGVTRERWTNRMVVVARDPELSGAGRPLLTLDAGGLQALRSGLLDARRKGDPFGLVVLDSLSRLKPGDAEENDNDAMSALLGRLQEIAEEAGAYIVLIHHVGHSERQDPRTAGRGASAIAAVAQVAWLLEEVPTNPRMRRLSVSGNAVLATDLYLEVASDTSRPGEVLYFRPVDPVASHKIEDLVAVGEELSISQLAWRIAGRGPRDSKDRPPGPAAQVAKALRTKWEKEGLVKTFRKRQAYMLRRLDENEQCGPS
jgi:replicative DNA helicase